jgi:hypothetical protein
MKKTKALFERFKKLADGKTIPATSLNDKMVQQMLQDRILVVISHGSRKSLRVADADLFKHYLASQFDIHDLDALLSFLENEKTDRASQVKVTGDSKFIKQRTFKGFLVNSYHSIQAELNGKPINIIPPDGSYLFISDYENFSISPDVIVVGIENSENFRCIKRQQRFFEQNLSSESRLLFVNRYPQEQHYDLICWLKAIPNHYIHFGDLDLAGIAIYQNEYYRHLGSKSSFLIPKDYSARIAQGNRERYDAQLRQYGRMNITDNRLAGLLSCIHHYHRGYDQEGFIN